MPRKEDTDIIRGHRRLVNQWAKAILADHFASPPSAQTPPRQEAAKEPRPRTGQTAQLIHGIIPYEDRTARRRRGFHVAEA